MYSLTALKRLMAFVSLIFIVYTSQAQTIGSVTLSTPSSGSNYYVGSSFNFSWSAASGANAYDFEYDSGTSYEEKVTVTGTSRNSGTLGSVNIGTHTWRVRGKNGSRIGPWSATRTYTVVNPSLTLNTPSGGQSWTIGSSQNITWSSNGITGNVKIEINGNYPSGAWEVLFSNIPNDGSEPWTVSGVAGTAKRIRITSVSNTSINDISNSNFALVSPTISLTSPNGGESWVIGATQNITWTSSGLTGNVNIEANGNYPSAQWLPIITNTANDGSAPWFIEGVAGNAKRIRVTSVNSPTVSDFSASNFSLTNPTLSLTSPNGGESYVIGTTQNITWTSTGLTGNVNIEANGNYPSAQWLPIITNTANDGSAPWFIEGVAGNAKRIRVTSVNNPTVSDFSASNFTLTNPTLSLTSPNGGESYVIGSTQTITWTSTGLTGNVKIEVNGIYPSTDWRTIIDNTPNDGSANWFIEGEPGTAKRIRITSINNPTVTDFSSNNFTLVNPTINLTSPNGGESWIIGATQNITWTAPNLTGNVRIEANGVYPSGEWKTIIDNTPNDGTAPWFIEGEPGTAKRIRITSMNFPSVSDFSGTNFTLTNPSINLISPNGGESYVIGTTQNITWSAPNLSGNVKIEVNGIYPSTDWRTIIDNTPNDGTAPWFIEGVAGTAKRIRISSMNDPTISDLSSSNFTLIDPTINLTSPNGGESYVIGTTQNITWSAPNLIGNVKIEVNGIYPANDWRTIIDNTPNDGSASWFIEGEPGTAKRIRITSMNFPSVTDMSSSNFTLTNPTITLISPNGGESYAIGTTQNITWSAPNLSGNVKIEVNGIYPSTDWRTIIDNTPNDGTAPWFIEGEAGTAKRIRITSMNFPTVTDFSSGNFTLTNPTLTITSPKGGENYVIGTKENITWSAPNLTGNVKIEANGVYPTGEWKTIIANTPNDGTEPWFIEGEPGAAKRIRITSMNIPTLSSTSQSNFTLTGGTTSEIISPKAGEEWRLLTYETITWSLPGVAGNVKIEANGSYPSGEWKTIIASTSNDGFEPWWIEGVPGNEKRIRVTSLSMPNISIISQNNFSIINEPQLEWMGEKWTIKNHPSDITVGPEANNWSGSKSSVWTDKDGYLHLKIKKIGHKWFSSEIHTLEGKKHGYGEYTFQIISPVNFEKNVVFGLFTYDFFGDDETPKENEIDIEFSKWNYETGHSEEINSQYLYQYRSKTTNSGDNVIDPIKFSMGYEAPTTHKFVWTKDHLFFQSYKGNSTKLEFRTDSISEGTYSNYKIPEPGGEVVDINFYLYKNKTLQNEAEVIIKSFSFDTGATFDFKIENVGNTSNTIPGSNGKILMYDLNYNYLNKFVNTNSASIATFGKLTFGQNNIFETYHTPANPSTIFGEEFWGSYQEIHLHDYSKPVPLKRVSPYSDSYKIFNNNTNQDITGQSVPFGTPLRIEITSKNPDTVNAKSVKTRLVLDRDKNSTFDLDQTANIKTIQNAKQGGSTVFSYTFTPTAAGDYFGAVGTLVNTSGTNFAISDGWAWNTTKWINIQSGNQATTKPTVSTKTVTAITKTTASAGGEISDDGGSVITARGVCWSTTANPTTANAKTIDGTGTGSFTSSLTSLTASTTYHIRAYATNAEGTAYGNDLIFTTAQSSSLATLTTNSIISSITQNAASSGGVIISDGGSTITAKGICWSTSNNPTTADQKTNEGSGNGMFSSSLTSLSPNTRYYVRAYATNTTGTAYGESVSFLTLSNTTVTIATVSTDQVLGISLSSASSGGKILSDGGASITAKGVCWSLVVNPTITDQKTINGSGSGNFSSAVTGLAPGTTYHVRAYASNAIGTAYGADQVFTTSSASSQTTPLLSTTSAYAISATSVQSGGNIISDGGTSIVGKGICWSTSANPTTSNQKLTEGTGLSSFTSSISGLNPGTDYYVRAYATNTIGTAYGNEIILTTPIVQEPFSLPSTNFRVSATDETCIKNNNGKININAETQLNYTATIKINGQLTPFPFTTSLEVPNLEAGNYDICLTVEGEAEYKKCFTVVITEPKSLTLFSSLNNIDNSIRLELNGAGTYYINLNGKLYTTSKSSITLPALTGINKLAVNTDIPCQGVKLSTLINDVVVYPVPFSSRLNVNIYDPNSTVEIYSLDGKMVYSERFSAIGKKELQLNQLSFGIYILRLKTNDYEFNYKIIKQ